MLKGVVKTFGALAITIEMENKQQYYALLEHVDDSVLDLLVYPMGYLPVKFEQKNLYFSGITHMGPRYHAKKVELDLELILII
tara:strand:+ start:619 stop:867 length:249 start_codon:yes stop_codon:yes gene_type:complete